MPTSLRITSRIHITPLLDIHHPPFEKLYLDGVYWSLFKDRCTRPLSDRYMLENVRASLKETDVDGQHAYWLPTIGFHLGRLHGAILSPKTGQPRPDVTALACFVMPSARRGYDLGRQWYFIDSLLESPGDRRHTDARLIGRLQELEREALHFHEEIGTWYYALGCILGEMSGQLFPATSEEYARWEAQNRRVLAEEQERLHTHDTDPLDPVPVVENTV
jgi:hypothetical protein